MSETAAPFFPVPPLAAAPHTPHLAAPADARPRRALVLAGGGMRVAWQAGVLRALGDHGLSFAHGDGTSGGIINLAMLLSGLSPEEMCARWRTLDVKRFASLTGIGDYLNPLEARALGDADGIVRHVFPHLGVDPAKIRAARGMEGTFNLCNYTRKTVEAVPHTTVDQELLVAGISLPIFMPALVRGGTTYLDAVWIKDANLMEAVRRGAEELWVVWCIGNTAEYQAGAFNQYVHMIEMSANGSLFEEFERIRELNDRIAAGEAVGGRTRPVRLHLIRPERPLPLDPEFFLGRVSAESLIARGYSDAARYLAAMTEDGLPFTPEATQMQTASSPGIEFDEVMKGPFALGAADPETGREAGKKAGHELALHATVSVDDVERFLADPEHTGTLAGSVDYTPWGNDLAGTGLGVFNLFSPGDDPKTKYMVYELPFAHGGEQYYLAGKKVVRDDPGFDLWKDTTTLYTVLHRGTDRSGPVVGAGVLTLGVADFAKVMGAIRVTGADKMGEKAATLAKFGRFFAGELWDSYVKVAR